MTTHPDRLTDLEEARQAIRGLLQEIDILRRERDGRIHTIQKQAAMIRLWTSRAHKAEQESQRLRRVIEYAIMLPHDMDEFGRYLVAAERFDSLRRSLAPQKERE